MSDTSCSPRRLAARLALLRTPGLGAALAGRLVRDGHDLEALVGARPGRLRALGLPERAASWLGAPTRARIEADARWLDEAGARLVWRGEPGYPPRLEAVADPPLGLFVEGRVDLLAEPQLAIVGARAASTLGRDLAAYFADALARCGLIVTSGLARGVDAAAHRAALEAGGASIGVCGTGLDRVYPAGHARLARDLVRAGALVSELPPGAPPRREHFPRRNRILSGLSLGVLVVEAAHRSGSLITARLAAEQGREVFALPGSLATPRSRGCHALIREGATLVEEPADIVAELAPQLRAALGESAAPARVASARIFPAAQPDARPAAPAGAAGSDGGADLPDTERAVLEALEAEGVSFDTLVERTGLTPAALSSILTALELRGLIAREPGARFARRALTPARA